MVAVTGSVGKTTTKEMLRTIFEAEGPTHAAHASYNNHWGVPLTLARMPLDAPSSACASSAPTGLGKSARSPCWSSRTWP